MADERADIYLQTPTPDTGSADVEKTQVDGSDLQRPSQEGTPENNPETLGLPKSHWWRTIPLGLVFIAIAVGSEVVLDHTRNGIGFEIILSDAGLSRAKQFLKSFGPSILFGPLFHWFTKPYVIKLLKPFETKRYDSKSDVPIICSHFILLFVVRVGLSFSNFRMHHWAVSILSWIAISGSLFHALAGAYFEIVPALPQQEVKVRISGKTALGYGDLEFTPFVNAAGFVGTASRIGGMYSPFILNDTNSKTGNIWVVPDFTLEDPSASAQGGNVNVTLRGFSVQARCAPVPSPVISGPDTANRYNITGTLSHNCSATSNAISNGTKWDGWMVSAPFGCVRSIDPGNNNPVPSDPRFSPVAFSFLKNISSYSMVFCYSLVEEHDLTATLALHDDTPAISDVVDRGNVSFLSWGPSGIDWPSSDPRVEGIGDAIRFALAGSIMNLAGLYEIGAEIITSLQDSTLRDSNSVVGLAEEAVRIFQATVVPSMLIVGPPYFPNAILVVQAYGMVAIPHVAHVITVLCAIVGSILIALSIYHFWRRKELLTNAAPSATTTAPALAS
ncbi:uncharacterized protein EI90DRAFT_3122726 [Cantharellus anzutake]|uniref:uncharacterized protein n=1 Tax=Cantharellus anzutake TaxID=1750568 RepID=UPI0019081924|nr:uncharacterized protein EI90DRAFT_3122726 [Cantharellus anzutake]KAF8332294.1 hypothetical protein EI90DRAFT_3122726 [Cantharellus anzutake]